MGNARHYERDPESPVSAYSDTSCTDDQIVVITPPHRPLPKQQPVSSAEIHAFGSWRLRGGPSFASDLSPERLKAKMRRSAQVLGRAMTDPVSPPPQLASVSKRATYSGLGLGVAEKVSLRTARSSIIHLSSTVRVDVVSSSVPSVADRSKRAAPARGASLRRRRRSTRQRAPAASRAP